MIKIVLPLYVDQNEYIVISLKNVPIQARELCKTFCWYLNEILLFACE